MAHQQRDLITSLDAWTGSKIQHDPSWIHQLNTADVAEIDAALRHAKHIGARIPYPAESFPLPCLAATLDGILEELENGRGFKLIRGIPRRNYTDEECELIYWGLGAHLGNPVSQNARGHRLGHVRDEGRVLTDPHTRAYQTSQRMDFHTDMLPIDVLGLFCMRTAKSGGASKLTSALTIHNVLREEHPDLLETLYGMFHLDWRGEEPKSEPPWFTIPMFSCRDDKVTARICSLIYYESAARFGRQYQLTNVQRAALEAVQEIANRPELMLTMDFQEGDIQFINNHTMMHAREAYEDHDDPGRQRHLLRMWVAVPDSRRRPLADALTGRYHWVREGGIPLKPATTSA